MHSHEAFCGTGECHSLGNGIERRKEEGEGNWRVRNFGCLERTKQGAVSAVCKPSRPLVSRSIEQTPDSWMIQESRAPEPAEGGNGGGTTPVPNPPTR